MNKIIVESHNDQLFIEKLIENLNINGLKISEPICNIDEFVCLSGMGNLKRKLLDLKLDDIDKLGIVLDADEIGVEERIEQLNNVLSETGISVLFTKNNDSKYDEKIDLHISCHIVNIEGYGELEDLLMAIKTQASVYADCLDVWSKCLDEEGYEISKKDLIKFKVNNYIRFDTCLEEERKQVSKKCGFESALQKDIWDFDHTALREIKSFLALF